MRLVRPDHRTPQEPVIALVDVVFFLLVFFMLVARLDASAPFEVVPPVALSGEDMPGGGVTLSVGADGALAVNGQAAGADWLARVEAARAPGALVRVNAHAAAELRHVLPLLDGLEAAGIGARVVLVVTPGAP